VLKEIIGTTFAKFTIVTASEATTDRFLAFVLAHLRCDRQGRMLLPTKQSIFRDWWIAAVDENVTILTWNARDFLPLHGISVYSPASKEKGYVWLRDARNL